MSVKAVGGEHHLRLAEQIRQQIVIENLDLVAAKAAAAKVIHDFASA